MAQDTQHELPHDTGAEKALLACLLIDNNSFDEISDIGLSKDDFYHPQYSIIYEAIKDLHLEAMPIDMVTVSSKLNDHGKLEKIGGQSALISICDEIGSSANVEHYAKLIKQTPFSFYSSKGDSPAQQLVEADGVPSGPPHRASHR